MAMASRYVGAAVALAAATDQPGSGDPAARSGDEPGEERDERPGEPRGVHPPRALEAEGDDVMARRDVDGGEVGGHAANRELDAIEVGMPARVPALARHEGGRLGDVDLAVDVGGVAGGVLSEGAQGGAVRLGARTAEAVVDEDVNLFAAGRS